MKLVAKFVSLLIVLTFLLSAICIVPIHAADASASTVSNDSNEKKKIVSVVFDNSGSMDGNRYRYAKYALQTLVAMLDDDDLLFVTPMNGTYSQTSILVDFSLPNRGIDDVLLKVGKAENSTPVTSIDTAMKRLTESQNPKLYSGLKDDLNGGLAAENEEYWLIILTDGDFSGSGTTEQKIKTRIQNYSSLKTIYINFIHIGTDLRGCSLESEFAFQAYNADNGDELIANMQKIANHLTGRYNLPSSYYSINGNTVTLTLKDTDPSFRNISVIAQNSNATLASVTYNGKKIFSGTEADKQTAKYCQIAADSLIQMKAGCSAVIAGDPYFTNGTLTFTFSPIGSSAIDFSKLTFLAEPSLELETYFLKDGAEVTMQEINSTCKPGTNIKVGYRVKDQATGNLVNLNKIFPGATIVSKATYSGSTYDMTYNTSGTNHYGLTNGNVALVLGNKDIHTSVVVKTDAYEYSMYDSQMCLIMKEPTDFRVEATHPAKFEQGEAAFSYIVFVDGVKKTPSELKKAGYTWEITVTDPNGQTKTVTATEDDAAKALHVTYKATDALYGMYQMKFKVRASTGISRELVRELEHSISLDHLAIRCKTSANTLAFGTSQATVDFEVFSDSIILSKEELADYTLKAFVKSYDGTETEVTPTVSENGNIKVTLAIAPNVYGAYQTRLEVKNASGVSLASTHTYEIYPSAINITGEHADRFEKGETKAEAKYWIELDGVQLTAEDLNRYQWTITTYAPGGVNTHPHTVTVDPDGTIHVSFDVADAGYGAFETKLAFAISDTVGKEYSNTVKNYPKEVLINVVGSGKLSLSQHQLTENQTPVKFEVFLDGAPFVFNNGIVDIQVLVGDRDVTEFVTFDGNVVSYAPLAEHFGESLPLGDHTVTVRAICEDFPTLSTSASTSFTVTKTEYEIVALETPSKSVERFKLKDVNAVLHFQILRDGVPLPLAELQAAYDAGEITLKDEKGTFTWEFWLPCGQETSVKTVDGKDVVEFKVTRDFGFLGLDKVMGMFFFTGDKPVSITYQDAAASDAIHMQRGAVWVYLLIWFIIFFIVHVILFVLGFFNGKCKNLPAGTFASVAIGGAAGKMQTFSIEDTVNMTFAKKWLWHIGRFTLVGCFKRKKLWYNQPSFEVSGFGLTFGYNTQGTRCGMTFDNEETYQLVKMIGAPATSAYAMYETALRTYDGSREKEPNLELSGKDIRMLFQLPPNAATIKENQFCTGNYYGTLSKKQVNSVIIFAKKS